MKQIGSETSTRRGKLADGAYAGDTWAGRVQRDARR